MKKIIKIKQSDLNRLVEGKIDEMFGSEDKLGSIELERSKANPSDIKKFTSSGINVKLVDEELGEEQPVNLKHKFEGKDLNIYSTRDKVTIKEVLQYIDGMEEQDLVETSFDSDRVNLFIKTPSSGRYDKLGSFTKDALRKFRDLQAGESGEDTTLNESLSQDMGKE